MDDRFIDNFDVILLDMGQTFMFDVDRFGEDQDYHATYRQIGGQFLDQEQLNARIDDVLDRMHAAYNDPARYDDFGNVRRFLGESNNPLKLPAEELELIVEVFARHEAGVIPTSHARAIRRLRDSHPLGLVSNVWAPKHAFETEMGRVGILDLFTIRVWSSEHLSVKPSPRLFQVALKAFDVDPSRVVYAGDDPKRDVAAAKSVGMATVWIENRLRPLTPERIQPDLIISDLTELPDALCEARVN